MSLNIKLSHELQSEIGVRRYWVDQRVELGIPLAISGELFKHIYIVCRQNIGDSFEILSDGKIFLVQVKDIHKSVMVVDVLRQLEAKVLKTPKIHLALSLPKIKTFEDVVEKAVELGVYSVQPFYSDFSFFKSNDRLQEKANRLRKIVISACQQSARVEEMVIHPSKSLAEVLKDLNSKPDRSSLKIYAFYEGQAESLGDFLKSEKKVGPESNSAQFITDIWIFVGSEGGFSTSEINQFGQFQIPSLSLGEQVLRVETACVSIISVLKYHYDLF